VIIPQLLPTKKHQRQKREEKAKNNNFKLCL